VTGHRFSGTNSCHTVRSTLAKAKLNQSTGVLHSPASRGCSQIVLERRTATRRGLVAAFSCSPRHRVVCHLCLPRF
jgi:hypothetical protein